MSIQRVRVSVLCDECGKLFHVDMDEGQPQPAGWTIFDAATAEVSGGALVEGAAGVSCSVQNGKHLCGECTRSADESEETQT